MDYRTASYEQRTLLLDEENIRRAKTGEPPITMFICHSIPELEEELAGLDRQMQAIQGRLNAYAADNATATAASVVATRNAWMLIKARQTIRRYELEEAIIHGEVRAGSFERAQARIVQMAED